jgi:ABC-type nitrate/sulfonate/bicarbonate transport system ATPase subunit
VARIGLGIAFFVLFVGLWSLATFGGWVSPFFLADPLTMVREGVNLLVAFGFAYDIAVTIWRVVGGFALAAVIGVPLGILMGAFKPVEAFLEPFVSFARYLPASAFIPLLILWAGLGEMQKLLVIFIGSFFQLVIMVSVAVGSVRRDLVEAAYALGGTAFGDREPRAAAGLGAGHRRDPAARPGLGLDLRDRGRADRVLVGHRAYDRRQSGSPEHRPDHLRHHGHQGDRARLRLPFQGAEPAALPLEPGLSGLVLEGVSRTFAGARGAPATRALEPTNLKVPDNDFVAILGPSGCGKSTLLRIVAGLDRPSTGRVLLDGQEVSGPGPDRGMVFQSYTLFPWLSVARNIAFGLRERGVAAAERERIVAAYVAKVGLTGFERHYPKQLSGGMQQRTAIARALANEPLILLLDEPFGALDNQTRSLMQELLLTIWEAERKTVLFVTHDIEEAIFLANRVVVMTARPGRIKADVAVPLSHPRDYRMKTGSQFSDLKARLVEEIRVEAMRAG